MKKDFEFYKGTKPFKLFDLIVLGVIIALVVALLLVLFLPKEEGSSVEIYRSGKLIGEFKMSDYSETSLVKQYGSLIVCITGDSVSVLESDCPDKCCVKQGEIRYDGESIICVPQEIVIKIVGGDKLEVEDITK